VCEGPGSQGGDGTGITGLPPRRAGRGVGALTGDGGQRVIDASVQPSFEFNWRGRTGPFPLLLTPGVFTPTHTSVVLADALEITAGDVVIDVGCGCGVLAVVAARLGAGRVVGCDVSSEAIRMATFNAECLGVGDRTEFRAGHLFDPVRDVRADVIIGDVSGIPNAVAELTGWFPGGPTGAEIPVAMLDSLGGCLKPGGRLYLPTLTIQAPDVLTAARRIFGPGHVELVAARTFPLPAAVARSSVTSELVSKGIVHLERRGTRLLWQLSIWRCQRPIVAASGGHTEGRQ
jgi:precorrin-6B methylase 2